jgi:hypothetical protein
VVPMNPARGTQVARPRFKVTAENRNAVEKMAAIGVSEENIAKVIGIDPKTLRKHFRLELPRGAAKGEVAIRQKAYEMALDGKHPSITLHFLDKMDAKQIGYGPRMGIEDARAKLAHLIGRRHAAMQRQKTPDEG